MARPQPPLATRHTLGRTMNGNYVVWTIVGVLAILALIVYLISAL